MEYTYPDNVGFACNCCGLCCGDTEEKTRRILLLEAEAEEISAQTGLPIEDFAAEIAGNAPYIYEMKKPQGGKCFFLKDNRCSIYTARPLICRFYPFELRFDPDRGIHVFSYTQECPTINKGKTLGKKDFEALYLLAKQRLR
ncbi:MAG: YkgJ family cysteine cluster protein [Candidatus Bathyarchaeota archaeon]|nr:YkgJ family cysteine cluster protein [Candidatus Bathyarchaeota archaeon]